MSSLEKRYFEYDKNLRKTLNIDQMEVIEKPSLEKRYINYATESRKTLKNSKKEEDERKRAENRKNKIKKAFAIYDEALEALKKYKEQDLLIIGKNLYAFNKKHNIVRISKEDFKNVEGDLTKEARETTKDNEEKKEKEQSDYKKKKYYSAIHTVQLCKKENSSNIYPNFRNTEHRKSEYKKVSENAIRILYELSNGDLKTLYTLAKLCIEVISGNSKTKKPYVILADKEMHRAIWDFFSKLTNNAYTNIHFNELTKVKPLDKLFVEIYSGTTYAIAVNSRIPETEFSVKKIKKLISGKTICMKNPLFPENLYFEFHIPFIYVTDNHLKYRKMKTLYNAIDIKILTKNLNTLPYDMYGIQFLKHRLSDLIFSYESDKEKFASVSKRIANDDIFKEFVVKYCTTDENSVCEKAQLYEAYCEYYRKNFGDEPLTKILFSKKFAAFGNFETVRPHTSREHYPYCFKGIKLDKAKVKQLSNENTARYFSTYDKFENDVLMLFGLSEEEINDYNSNRCR